MSKVELRRKRLSRDRVKQVIDAEKAAGRRVVFTNGCFDLLHAGHVRYLEAARRLGNVLLVAVNSDASVRQLKGEGRPILPLDERLRIVQALSAVDYVVAFDEPTPRELLSELKPDVLVKGGDYGVEGVIGREIVWAYGGEVCVVPATEDLSTTQTVERMRTSRS